MSDHDVDLFVIGAGSGGVRAARIAASYGARVMIAEEYRVGGTCVIRGCVPKKLLVYASRFSDEFEDAAGYGWTVPEPTFHWPTLIANVNREVARLEAAYTATLERFNVALVKSRAVLEDAHTVRLASGARVHAETILICDRRLRPIYGAQIAGLEHAISSNEAFHLQGIAQTHSDPGRRLYRSRVRRHLRRARQPGDAGLSRREYPARLRRRRPRTFAQARCAAAASRSSPRPHRRGDRDRRATATTSSCPTTSRIMADMVMFATGRRPNVHGAWPRKLERQDRRDTAASPSMTIRRRRCRISMPSATSPTASI